MNYGKKGTIGGFRFKKSYADYQEKGKPATRAFYKRKLRDIPEDVEPTAEHLDQFIKIVEAISPDMVPEIVTNGLPKQIFISPDTYFKVKHIFEAFPIRVVKHRHLDSRTIKFDWNENKFIKTPNKKP